MVRVMKLTHRDDAAGRQVYVESATGRTSWNVPSMSPARPASGPRAHPSAAQRMSMPVNPVARPAPGVRPMRPGMHGRAPSMQVPGTRVPSGPRPAHRAMSASMSVTSPGSAAVRSPPMGLASPTQPQGARPTPVRPMRPPMPGRPLVRRASAAPLASPHHAAPATGAAAMSPTPTPPHSAPIARPRPPMIASPPGAAPPSAPVTSPVRTGPRASSAANRRRAYATAHAAAHSVSYHAQAPASGDADVFTPAALSGHMSTRSVSGVPASPAARVAPGSRAVSAGNVPAPPSNDTVPPVPLVPADVSAPGSVPGAPMPAGVPAARVGNQLVNAVVGAQPPNMAELDAPPPPIVLPPNATVTLSDRCNADPSYQRCTMNAIPATQSLMLKSKLPLAIVLSPMRSVRPEEGDAPVPLVTDTVIARCRRCRTYINPFVSFVEGGHRWKCCMCGITNEVPQLFDWDATTNQATDRWRRPELNAGVVEFVAPREYMVRPPQPPVYVFLLDVSYAAVSSGMLATAASAILSSLDTLPNKDHRTKVAFIAYDAQLHFFQLVPGRTEPSLLVVSDVDHVFLPQPNDLIVNLTECRAGVESLLRGLPAMYAQAAATPCAMGAALQAAFKLCSASGGKLEVFSASLPSIGPGALKMRDDKKLYGGPRESSLLQAASPFYKTFAIECSRSQVSVDMWLFGPAYVDVATLSCLPRYTGGQTFYYPTYDAQHPENARKFAHELHKVLSSPISFEAVLRLRATRGIRTLSFHGNFFVRSSDLLALPSVPSDQSYMIECEVDEPLHVPFVVFQSVVLHSTSDGERRIRVMTTALPTTTSLSELYASADQVAIAAYLANKAVEKSLHARLDDARGLLRSRLADILNAYRQAMTNTRGGNAAHLMVAQNLSLLPLLVLGLLRNRGLRMGTQIPSDVRAYNHTLLTTLPLQRLVPLLLPVLYSLHNMPANAGLMDVSTQTLTMPPRLSLSSERFERHGLYLIEDGMSIFLWLGRAAVPALTMDVFGAPDYAALRSGPIELPELDNAMSRRVRAIVERVTTQRRGVYLPNLYLVKEDGDAGMRLLALSRMIEDRYEQTSGYLPFLGQLRDKLQHS